MRVLLLMALVGLVGAGCSSQKVKKEPKLKEKEHKKLKPSFVVKEASSEYRPAWIEDAPRWAQQYREDASRYRYFSYMTEPKLSRSLACSLAQARGRADVAAQIGTYLRKQLDASQEGRPTAELNQGLQEYVEETLSEDIEAQLVGVSTEKTYWEKRQYLKKKGAPRDYQGYTCGALVKIEKAQLNTLMQNATKKLLSRTIAPAEKAYVQSVLEKSSSDFIGGDQ